MSTIGIESHKEVALLRLSNGVTNAINEEMVADLSEALADIRDNFRGLVLAGGDKFFSIGLDLPHLLKRNREEMDAFWQRFDQVLLDLFTLPVPSAAAINGHAVADLVPTVDGGSSIGQRLYASWHGITQGLSGLFQGDRLGDLWGGFTHGLDGVWMAGRANLHHLGEAIESFTGTVAGFVSSTDLWQVGLYWVLLIVMFAGVI